MKAPYIVSEHGDLMIFASKDSLERKLEPIDVENGEYVVWDSEGRRLRLVIQSGTVLGLQRIALGDSEEFESEKLKHALRDYLENVGLGNKALAAVSLSDLVETARQVAETE